MTSISLGSEEFIVQLAQWFSLLTTRKMTQIPRISTEITHHHGHNSNPQEFSIEKDLAIDLTLEQLSLSNSLATVPTTYKYLEWSTQPSELYPFPDRLPSSITKQIDPFKWAPRQKRMILALACFSTGMAAYSAGAYTSGLGQMSVEWGVSRVALLVGVTTFTTGFALAPLFLAPLSEVSEILGLEDQLFFGMKCYSILL